MRCFHVMHQPVVTILETDSIEAAAERMRSSDIDMLPVCSSSGAVVGTITEHDIVLRVVAERRTPIAAVGDVMTRDVVLCRPQDEFFVAQELMRLRHVLRVVCADNERRPVGIIGLRELVQYEDGFRLAKTVRGALNQSHDAGPLSSKTPSGSSWPLAAAHTAAPGRKTSLT